MLLRSWRISIEKHGETPTDMARAWGPIHAGALRRWPSHVALRRIPQIHKCTSIKNTKTSFKKKTFVGENHHTKLKLSTRHTQTQKVHKSKKSHLANSKPCHPCPFRRRRPVVRRPRRPRWPSPIRRGRRSAPWPIAVTATAAPPSSVTVALRFLQSV